MSKFGFLPSGSGIPFEAHLEKLDEPAKAALLELRRFIMSLGSNVIEEVRPHRIVYAKTMTFRTFLDVEPAIDHLVVELRSGRENPPARTTIKTRQDVEEMKNAISEAFAKIR